MGPIENYLWLAETAETRYFQYCAYDDKWSQDYTSRLRQALVSSPAAILATGTTVQVMPNGAVRRVRDPAPARRDGLAAIGNRLTRVCAGWFYGLYDRDGLLPILRRAAARGDAWGFDMMVLLPLLAGNAVVADDQVTFFQRMTGESNLTYKPRCSTAQWKTLRRALGWTFEELSNAGLARRHQALLAIAALRYAERSSVRLDRIISNAVKERALKLRATLEWRSA